jgi:hypothetical protein
MQTSTASVLVLKVFLAALFVFLLAMQVFSLPGQFVNDAANSPKTALVSWMLLAATEVGALCFEVVIVCTWRLLTMVRRDSIFSRGSLPWVDAIMWAVIVAWVTFAVAAVSITAFIYFTPGLRDPGVPILLFGLTLAGAVVPLLVMVLRALLRQAAELRAEIDVVI